jgi:hypothetical protein
MSFAYFDCAFTLFGILPVLFSPLLQAVPASTGMLAQAMAMTGGHTHARYYVG